MNTRLRGGTIPLTPLSRIDDRFQVIFDSVNDGIFVTDPDTGSIIEVNERGCVMFGYEKSELLGKDAGPLSSGVAPHTLEAAMGYHEKTRSGMPQVFEWRSKAKDGTLFWSEVSMRYTEFGNIPAIVSIIRDISEHKRLVIELTEALQDAHAASEAKSTFLATMSHELRTPLNAIIGFSDLMLSGTMGTITPPRYHEYVHDIHASGQHLLALINDVLDLSRLNAGMAILYEEEVSLCQMVTEACSMVRELALRSGIDIFMQLPSSLPRLHGDQRRIKQILLNLLSNAIKFTARGGTVTVSARHTVAGLQLEVCDTGIGISEADLPLIFEQFRQADSSTSRLHEGSGLGLPLVKRLTELHGGSVAVSSVVDSGTVMTLTFPDRCAAA